MSQPASPGCEHIRVMLSDCRSSIRGLPAKGLQSEASWRRTTRNPICGGRAAHRLTENSVAVYFHAAVMYLPQRVGTIVTRWLLISMTLHPETLPGCAGPLSDEELAWQLQQQLDLEDAAAMGHHSQHHSSQLHSSRPHIHNMPPGFNQHYPAVFQPALAQQAQHGTAALDTGLRQDAGSHGHQQQQQPEAVSAGQAIAMSMFSYGGDPGEDDQGDGGRFGGRRRGRHGGGGRIGGSRGRGRSRGR